MRELVILPVVTVLIGTLLLFIRFGGQQAPVAHPAKLVGTTWQVSSVADQRPDPNAVPTIAFDDRSIHVVGACNRRRGTYVYEPTGATAIGSLDGPGAVACANVAAGNFERRLASSLAEVDSAAFDSTGALVLSGGGDPIRLAPTSP